MKFTVLGASGFIGGHLSHHLTSKGFQVATPRRGDPSLFDEPLGHVIYAIGLTADFRNRPLETVQAHVCVLRELLEKAQFDSMLYLSSTRVYAGMSETSEDSELRVAPLRAEDLYNMSKLMGESLALHSRRTGVRVARLSNVIGDEGMPAENFLPDIVTQALRGKVSLRSSPASEKDYIDIEDVVELLPAIALHGQRSIYNVASGHNLAHRDWIGALRQTLEFELRADSDLPLIGFSPISIHRLAQEFGTPSRSPIDRLPALVRRLGQSASTDLRPPKH